MWAIWTRSGDPEIDRLMARGVEEMEQGNYKAAIATFSEVVKKKPDFAEGWNPRHFGTLSGLGQIYYRLDEWEKSIEWYRKALEVIPNMGGVELNLKALEAMQRERKGKSI